MWVKIKIWAKDREEGLTFLFFLFFIILPGAILLYELSYIPFPEGTLGP